MNQLFEKLLRDYQIDERFKEPLKDQLLLTYQSLTSTDKEIVRALKQNLRDVELKLEKIEERFALGEIDRPVYDKIGGKIKEEKKNIEAQLEVSKNKLSAHLIHSKKY
jgi:site-specific DNA recombinase